MARFRYLQAQRCYAARMQLSERGIVTSWLLWCFILAKTDNHMGVVCRICARAADIELPAASAKT